MKPKQWLGCYDDSWKGVITSESFMHPAKFSKGLIERILDYMTAKQWIQKGDAIGEPFLGVGTLAIVGAYRGFQIVGRELEPAFFCCALDNMRRHRHRFDAMNVPQPILTLGDSRAFDKAVAGVLPVRVSAVVTSPAYSGSLDTGGREKQHPDGYERANDWSGYGTTAGQIGALPTGELDAIVTSQPFLTGDSGGGRGINVNGYSGAKRKDAQLGNHYQGRRGDRDPANIERAPVGTLKAVVTSPAYADTIQDKSRSGIDFAKCKPDYPGRNQTDPERVAHFKERHGQWQYGDSDGQIGALPKGDVRAVVTSPPWEDNVEGGFSKGKLADPMLASRGNGSTDAARTRQLERDAKKTYGNSSGQIGKLKRQTYWEAMAEVYASCFRALEPGGYMAVVVKDFVKKKQRVCLCDDTMKLLRHVGFEKVERIHAMLTAEYVAPDLFEGTTTTTKSRKSFFRRLNEQRPGYPCIDYEEVLIVRKPL